MEWEGTVTEMGLRALRAPARGAARASPKTAATSLCHAASVKR